MSKIKIVYRPTASLIPYVGNARTHSDEQVRQIGNSITEFGFVNPVLVDGKGVIIAGHGRVMAAKAIGLEQVPVIELGNLSERQRKALTIADNKIAMNASWNMELLAHELSDLVDAEMDLSLTGFDEQELDSILKADVSILPEAWSAPVPVPTPTAPQPVHVESDNTQEMAQPNPAVDTAPPAEFKEYDEKLHTDFRCPSCSYEWSGKPK